MRLIDTTTQTARRGVSLVEFLIVMMILGIIGSIAIPRSSRGSRTVEQSSLVTDLAILRSAISLYASEHQGQYPGTNADGTAGDTDLLAQQLTQFTSAAGQVAAERDDTHPFGPYLRRGIPDLSVGVRAGNNKVAIDIDNLLPQVNPAMPVAWVYNPLTGDVIANSDEIDKNGYRFSDY